MTANAGIDRTCFVNEVVSLDGSASTNIFDGLQPDGHHSIQWDFGYGGFTYEGALVAPVAYPEPGTFTVTLKTYDSTGQATSDTAVVTVEKIPLGNETILSDSGDPVANMHNLQSAIDAAVAVDNKVITLPAGFIAQGTLVLKHRSVANYCTIRTANYASLPEGKRVSPADSAHMAVIQQTVSGNIIDTPELISEKPARYYNLVGIWLRKWPATLPFIHNFCNLGWGNETTLAQLVNHIIFDRCYFDGGSETSNTLRGIFIRGNDCAVVNCYLYRFKGVGIEAQAVLFFMGERCNVMNNYLQGGSENFLTGGGDTKISNHNPTDLVFRRNHLQKDLGWRKGDPAYYGVDLSIKNVFELKLANRASVQGNIFENHWIEDQNYSITITVRNQDGNAPWAVIQYVDFSYNRILKTGNNMSISGTDNNFPSQKTNHFLVRHNVFAGNSQWNGQHIGWLLGAHDKVSIVNNSTDNNGDPMNGQGRAIEWDETVGCTNFVFWANICQGFFSSAVSSGAVGDAAFKAACSGSSYSVKKNGLYRSKGTNPSDNKAVALITDVKYANLADFDFALLPDSPFIDSGLLGLKAGADTDAVDALTSGVVSGIWETVTPIPPEPEPEPPLPEGKTYRVTAIIRIEKIEELDI